jgi:hypothetical protein
VSPNYFDVLGVRLLAGRTPQPGGATPEVVINRRMADLFWPGESPLGKTIDTGFRADAIVSRVVVGIAPDLPGRTIVDRRPTVYPPTSFVRPLLVVRSLDPDVVDRLAQLVASLQPDAAVTATRSSESAAETMLPARIGGQVAWGIGALALVLATVGAFGVFAFVVEQRRREVGIRMALGARASEVVWHVLRSTQAPVLAGAVIGVGIALAAAPLLGAYLYGLSPFDPVAYLQVALIVGAAGALATWIPARRATRVNPAEVLRAE